MNEPDNVPRALRTSAAYGWRILVLCGAGYLVLNVLGQLEFVVVAIFVGLVIAAICSPIVKFFDKFLPRGIAVLLGLLILLLIIIGIFGFIGGSVAGEWGTLNSRVRRRHRQDAHLAGGPALQRPLRGLPAVVRNWRLMVQRPPRRSRAGSARRRGNSHRSSHRPGAGSLLRGLFLGGGTKIGISSSISAERQADGRINGAGHVAWRSFAGYTAASSSSPRATQSPSASCC